LQKESFYDRSQTSLLKKDKLLANICKNQIILSGNRSDLLALFISENLNFSEYKIFEISNNIFTFLIDSKSSPPKQKFLKLSKLYPTIDFQILYAEKAMNKVGIIDIKNNHSQQTKLTPSNSLAPSIKSFIRKKDFFLADILTQKSRAA